MDKDISFVQMGARNKHLVLQNEKDCFGTDGYSEESLRKLKEDFTNYSKYTYVPVWLMGYKGRFVGHCILSVTPQYSSFLSFGIRKERRQQGYGSYLLEYLMKWYEEKSSHKFYADIKEDNLPAQKMFKRANFKLIKQRKVDFDSTEKTCYVFKWNNQRTIDSFRQYNRFTDQSFEETMFGEFKTNWKNN